MKARKLILAVLFPLWGVGGFAQTTIDSGSCGANLTWKLTSDSVLTISGSGAMADYNNYSSTIPAPWYSSRISFTAVVINSGVTSIGSYAFYNCWNLKSVTIGNNVTSIGSDAFHDCWNLISLTIGDNVTSIGDFAFYDCYNLISVIIGNNVTSIGISAFYYCSNLTSIVIPNSVKSIGKEVFYKCYRLTSIDVDGNNTVYRSEDGVLFNKSKTTLIQYPYGKIDTNYSVPNSVTTIGDCAFEDCTNLISVTIGNNVTIIGNSAFAKCSSLISVNIPNSVTTIGDDAFYYCSSLTSITIPNSVATIRVYTFQNCYNLTSVIIGNNVTTIEDYAFCNCIRLTSVTIPNSVTTIGGHAFYNCYRLTSVTIGNNVTDIREHAFRNCTRLTSVTIPNSVKYIGGYAFYNCTSLTSITSYAIAPPVLGAQVFDYVLVNIPVYIPCGSYNSYSKTRGWSDFTNFVISASDTTSYNKFICQGEIYTDNNFTTSIFQTGTYYATLVNSRDCDSVIVLNLTVNPLPDVPAISKSENTLTSSEAYSYQWYRNNQAIAGATAQSYIYTQNGIYFVAVANEYGCIAKSEEITITDVGIVETQLIASLPKIYPNPTNGKLKVGIAGQARNDGVDIAIFDVVGCNVGAYRIRPENDETTIDISHLASGMYFLKIDNKVVKVMKE
jgi:hypothetical protein